MHIGIIGTGKMGLALSQQAQLAGFSYSLFSRGQPITYEPDVLLHFATPDSVLSHLQEALECNKPIVIGTTGWDTDLEKAIEYVTCHGGTALFAPNFSIGVLRWVDLVEQACTLLSSYDRCGIDIHHRDKKDIPSGTAKWISARTGIPFSSLRLGKALPHLEVLFDNEEEQITLTHHAKSRTCFAKGALQVAVWLCKQKGWQTIDDYLHSTHYSI